MRAPSAAALAALLALRASAAGLQAVNLLRRQLPSPCPCLNKKEEDAKIEAAVAATHASAAGEVEAAGEAAAAEWEAELQAIIARVRGDLNTMADRQFKATTMSLEAERRLEATRIAGMLRSIEEARRDLAWVTQESADWARSQAENEVARLTGSNLEKAWAEDTEAESFRKDAINSTQATVRASKRMLEAAREAQGLAARMTSADATGAVQSAEAENQAAAAQAQQAQVLLQVAWQAVQQAKLLAGSAVSRATAAEALAEEALGRARNNTRRIAALKLRIQTVQQLADKAAGGR
mmetsp:Transcript_106350/g.343057  ORF Transcript_106350/g.343057 Transcript_106350/m.343057 type:complete len:295 (+) Transcript_106350:83-967(+)